MANKTKTPDVPIRLVQFRDAVRLGSSHVMSVEAGPVVTLTLDSNFLVIKKEGCLQTWVPLSNVASLIRG